MKKEIPDAKEVIVFGGSRKAMASDSILFCESVLNGLPFAAHGNFYSENDIKQITRSNNKIE